jgi:hypothetical protein
MGQGHRACLAIVTLAGALSAFAVAGTTASAQEAAKIRVGITVAVKVNVSDIEARILSDSLGRALAERFDITVVAGEDAEGKLPPGGVAETCIADTECLRETARALDVDKLLVLVAVRVGDQVSVDATVFDVASGESEPRPSVKMTARERQWKDAFTTSAPQILPEAPVRESPETAPPGLDPEPDPDPPAATPPAAVAPPGAEARPAGLGLGFWVSSGVAVGGIAVAAVLWSSASSRFDECHPVNDDISVCDDEPWKGRALAGDIAGGVALAAGVTAAVLYFTRDRGGGSADVAGLEIVPGPGDVGLAVGHRF